MDEDAVLLAIGGLTEAVKNQGREIGDMKKILGTEARNCRTCRKEIDGDIAEIKNLHTSEAAVKSWTDSVYTKLAAALVTVCSLIGLFLGIRGS